VFRLLAITLEGDGEFLVFGPGAGNHLGASQQFAQVALGGLVLGRVSRPA